MLVLQDLRVVAELVDEQPSKRSQKNGDKSALAMLKRNERHQRTGRPVLDA